MKIKLALIEIKIVTNEREVNGRHSRVLFTCTFLPFSSKFVILNKWRHVVALPFLKTPKLSRLPLDFPFRRQKLEISTKNKPSLKPETVSPPSTVTESHQTKQQQQPPNTFVWTQPWPVLPLLVLRSSSSTNSPKASCRNSTSATIFGVQRVCYSWFLCIKAFENLQQHMFLIDDPTPDPGRELKVNPMMLTHKINHGTGDDWLRSSASWRRTLIYTSAAGVQDKAYRVRKTCFLDAASKSYVRRIDGKGGRLPRSENPSLHDVWNALYPLENRIDTGGLIKEIRFGKWLEPLRLV